MVPHPAHAREVVLELRQLDLELSLGAPCVLGEDVENQLRPVDDARLERVLERTLLGRRELLVHEQHLGVALRVLGLQLGQLALADERLRIRPVPVLNQLGDRVHPCGAGELPKLRELFGAVRSLREHAEDEPALRLRPRSGIGLARCHRRDYGRCRLAR